VSSTAYMLWVAMLAAALLRSGSPQEI
jgi:hypothetical protein